MTETNDYLETPEITCDRTLLRLYCFLYTSRSSALPLYFLTCATSNVNPLTKLRDEHVKD